MTGYKLTTQGMTTHGGCRWKLGEWKQTSGEGRLCGPGWLHCYTDPLLAILLNFVHADVQNPRLFECECAGEMLDDRGLKRGHTRMRLTREIDPPIVTTEQRIRFAILCARAVYDDKAFQTWADRWLSGEDRSQKSLLNIESRVWKAQKSSMIFALKQALARDASSFLIRAWTAEAAEAAATEAVENLDLISLAYQACEREMTE